MSRFNLPEINFLEKDPELIERDILFHIEEKTGMIPAIADPRRKYVQAMVAYVAQERARLDHALKQNLLAYAEDEFLDHKGEDVSTPRLAATAATTTMEIELEEERVSPLTIEAGTLFLVGEDTYFETRETVVVPVGQHTVQVQAVCTETGEKGNGYLPGEITELVRPLPWVKSVRNITTSAGGSEVEDDDAYAERIRLAPESFSVAGPEGAYIYWAKTASQDIVDVVVERPAPGTVDIRVLMKDGELPTQEILDKVFETCSDKTVRPLTDLVTVNAPEVVLYDVDAQYWVLKSSVSSLAAIQEQVEKALQEYLLWQKSKMGRDVDLSELIARLKAAGAYRVAVNSQMYKAVEKYQVAKENTVNLTFGGLVDE